MKDPVLTATEVQDFIDLVFPQQRGVYQVVEVASMHARLTQKIGHEHLRPGDTVSGPTMFAIADCAFYAASMAMVGRQEMMVTSSLTINFLRKPPAADLMADARILKLGRTMITGQVYIYSDGVTDPVAHATTTYAVPRG